MSSLDRILPFLRPIEDLLVDPRITEVMVNQGGQRVFVERDGRLECVSDRVADHGRCCRRSRWPSRPDSVTKNYGCCGGSSSICSPRR